MARSTGVETPPIRNEDAPFTSLAPGPLRGRPRT